MDKNIGPAGGDTAYTIGIIDSSQVDRMDIQVSVMENMGQGCNIKFKEYNTGNGKDALLGEVQRDIENGLVTGLITEHRITLTSAVLDGDEVFCFVKEKAPEFPVVILTHDPDKAREGPNTDPDKVYEKKIFLDPELDETKKMVFKIIHNMCRYAMARQDLEDALTKAVQACAGIGQETDDASAAQKVFMLAEGLSRYRPVSPAPVALRIDIGELKQAAVQLKKYIKSTTV